MSDAIRIPNVIIELPGTTSRFLYEPMYVVPLIESYVDNAKLPQDRRIRVRGINPNNEMEAHLAFTVLDPTKSEGVESEYDRLRERYSARPKQQGGAPVFDVVYPGTSFIEAFEKARNSKGLPPPRNVETPRDLHPLRLGKPATGELLTVKGVTPHIADALAGMGIVTVDDLANARVMDIMALPAVGDAAGELIQSAAVSLRIAVRADQAPASPAPEIYDDEAFAPRPVAALP